MGSLIKKLSKYKIQASSKYWRLFEISLNEKKKINIRGWLKNYPT